MNDLNMIRGTFHFAADRRLTWALLGAVTLIQLIARAGEMDLRPGALRTEYLVNPAGLDATAPRLSWQVESATRGQKQTAYRLLVASSHAAFGAVMEWAFRDLAGIETDGPGFKKILLQVASLNDAAARP